MARPRPPEPSAVQEAREAYFAGEITADEYLHRVLPTPDLAAGHTPGQPMPEQHSRPFVPLRERLKAKRRSG